METKASKTLAEQQKELPTEVREMYVAHCVTCLVGRKLRDCPNCLANIGLQKRLEILSELSKTNPLILQMI
jgi:hypothetical protein